MKKFSFWIILENNLYQEIEEVVAKYSKEYNSPVFVPHMTLHNPVVSTDEEVVRKVKQVVRKIKPFEIEVGDVEFSTTYFQCVFVRMKTSADLLNAHLSLKDALGVKEEHVFMPHGSLVYGNFDMETREKIANEIKLKGIKFMANKITIVRADSSDPKDWDVVEQVPLG